MFADRLKQLRKEEKLTQIQLAQIFNVANGTIAMWETGKREPDFDTISRLADYFDVSIDYLMGRVDQPCYELDTQKMLEKLIRCGDKNQTEKEPAPENGDGPSETAKCFMGLVDKLTPDQQQLLLAQLRAWTEQNQRQAPAAPPSGEETPPESALRFQT